MQWCLLWTAGELDRWAAERPPRAHKGMARATKTLRNVTGAWVKEQQVKISDGQIVGYQVNLKVTFVMEEPSA